MLRNVLLVLLLPGGVSAALGLTGATVGPRETAAFRTPDARSTVGSTALDGSISLGDAAKVLSDFNRGSAWMEQYEYAKAVAAYESALKTLPDWTAARFNLALAYLNMQGHKAPKRASGWRGTSFSKSCRRIPAT